MRVSPKRTRSRTRENITRTAAPKCQCLRVICEHASRIHVPYCAPRLLLGLWEPILESPVIARESRTTHSRALAKSLSRRFFASIDTFILGWILTGSPAIGGSIAGLEVLTKMALYYGHERAWSMVTWGVRAPTVAPLKIDGTR